MPWTAQVHNCQTAQPMRRTTRCAEPHESLLPLQCSGTSSFHASVCTLTGAMDAHDKQRIREILQLMQHMAPAPRTSLQRLRLLHGEAVHQFHTTRQHAWPRHLLGPLLSPPMLTAARIRHSTLHNCILQEFSGRDCSGQTSLVLHVRS